MNVLSAFLAIAQTIAITRSGTQPARRGPAENFTGSVQIQTAFGPNAPSHTSGAMVAFEPGARTAWHMHPLGQTLIVTAGTGRVQQWGSPAEEIRQGDVVWIPPNTKHWHGAAPNASMTHVAIVEQLDGKNTDWMEHVTDEQYNAPLPNQRPAVGNEPTVAQRAIGDISPKLVELTDRVLFGDVWERPQLSKRDRSLVTVSALIAMNRPDQLRSHLVRARDNGVTQEELIETITHLAFYSGWPNAVTAINVAKEVFPNAATKSNPGGNEMIDEGKNPFTLVYGGAITKNERGRVNIHPVTYKLNGIDIAANVYTPANYDAARKYPAIVVAHPNGGVKEQVAGLFAQRLAETGYITIAADAAYQGGSGGQPRYVDKPSNRIEDVHGMADFISQYPGVDVQRIGLLGICGGGGYSLKAAQTDKRFKAVATLSMFNSGRVRRNGFMDSQLSSIQERLMQASNARAKEAAGGEVLYSSGVAISDDEIAKLPFELYRQGAEYYGKTHAHPNSSGKYTLSSLLDLMSFDAATNMDLINQPLLMMAGSRADSLYMTEDAFKGATNAKEKELYLIDGASHIDTYWKPDYVNQETAKLIAFFGKHV